MSRWVDTRRLRIGMAQINTTVGDFAGNRQKILKAISEARSLGVDLLTFPELAICGYPPEDLLFKPQFIAENLWSLEKVVEASSGISIVVGFVDAREDIYNAAAIVHDGRPVGSELIPATIIDKPPSAELKPEQRDTDILPPYNVLDRVLTAYVEEDKSVEQIIAMGIDEEVVKRTARLVDRSEYKRRQAPPGVKITPRAFGRDRRLPITNRFQGDTRVTLPHTG